MNIYIYTILYLIRASFYTFTNKNIYIDKHRQNSINKYIYKILKLVWAFSYTFTNKSTVNLNIKLPDIICIDKHRHNSTKCLQEFLM